MTPRPRRRFDWRREVRLLVGQLDKAHSAVEALGEALDHGNVSSLESAETTANEAVNFAARSVKSLEVERPPNETVEQPRDAEGSTLAIRGAKVATVALDVMVDAMVALATTDDGDDTDFLVSVSMDAASAFEVGAAVVEATASTDESGMADLERALETMGQKALTKRVIQARPRVVAIKERVGLS